MVNGKWLMRDRKLLTVQEDELRAHAADIAKQIDSFLVEREQSVLSKLIALGGSSEEESFEVQIKVKIAESEPVIQALMRNEIDILYERHYHQHDLYFQFDDPSQGRLRYREDDFVDSKGGVSNTRARLTLLGVKREGGFEHDVLLSRSRFLAPATNSPRFYREYFKPKSEIAIEKDRLRWLIKYKDTEFYINLDDTITPRIGKFIEIKSRTWSRKDAENKSKLVNELLALLGASQGEVVPEDYIEIIRD
jgi:5-methylthioadenosine/S-adenosylhomocysteine deaminase